MIGSVSQAAFFYQNNIAAFKVLELLDFGSSIKKIYLENYDKGKHIDDVIIEYPNFTRYYQIKWSLNDDVYTVHNLINPQSDKSKSLVQELAEGYASCDRKKDSEIILYSTKKAGNQKQPKKDINNSLNELINNIHIPFINSPTNQVSDLPKYPEYETTIIKIRNATTLI